MSDRGNCPDCIEQIEAQAAEIERLTFELAVASEPSPYCPICGSCGIAGCCGPKRCLYPTTDQDDQIETLEAEIEKLREAGTKLRGYAEHDDSCSSVQRWQTSPCNCGYIDAWKQWDAALGETK